MGRWRRCRANSLNGIVNGVNGTLRVAAPVSSSTIVAESRSSITRAEFVRELDELGICLRRTRHMHSVTTPWTRMSRVFREIALALTLATAIGIGAAASQPPSPGALKSEGRPTQATANNPQNNPQGNPPAAPPSIFKDGTTGEEHKPAPDWWMIGLTGLLVIVGGLQVWSVVNQNNIMDKQTALMDGQLSETMKAANAATESARVATTALNMTHRPLLVVRHVVVDGIGDDGHLGDRFTNGYVWITNTGPSVATLIRVHTEWLFAEHLPIENPVLETLDPHTAPRPLGPATSIKIHIPDRQVDPHEYITINNAVEGTGRAFEDRGGNLFLIGYLKYTDAIGLRRRYFCRRYDTELHYFVEVDHPSYSYED
jgi:hypothetical protein